MFYTEEYFLDIASTLKDYTLVSELKDKSILITGANGLIGSAVVDFLIYLNEYKGANITIFVAGRNKDKMDKRFGEYAKKVYYKFVRYDANEAVSFSEQVDYIIHGASNAHPNAYVTEPVETMMSNFYGTNNLLQYLKEQKGGRLLLLSSSEVYGNKRDSGKYKETDYGYIDILNFRSCYPSSKRAAETSCSSYIKEYGVDCVIVRPGHVYGPTMTDADSRASAQFIRNALSREDIIMKSSGAQLRSYCHVFDCVSALFVALLRGKCGEAYNISNKKSIVTIREFAECLAKNSGGTVVFENPSDSEKASYNMMECSALDSDKLEALGWSGVYDLVNGVSQTIKSMSGRGQSE